jgi:distribution and morphology protein 31
MIFATANSLRLQGALSYRFYGHIGPNSPTENIARALSDYLTSETGVTVVFESAIVPKWKDSRISFKNVYISLRPKASPNSLPKRNFAHLHAAGYDLSNHPSYHHVEEENVEEPPMAAQWDDEDTNYTMFDLQVDSIDVTLSLWRWLDGKGLVQDAVIKGVRGVVGEFFTPIVPSTTQPLSL